MLEGKKVLLGITGGIAAYKTAFLVRLLIKAGAEVKVILTESAASFVTPLTLATLSKNPVHLDFIKEDEGTVNWDNHVELGLWADLMLIAPATANTLSKMANGVCDNLLMATYLSAKCPVYFAPAMDLDMYRHPSTKASIEKLESFGNILIPVASGELASGLEGEGRMEEPEKIIELVQKHMRKGLPLEGKKVLITAGPTYEAIDPVRYIGNHSTGLMGVELAMKAAALGAEVNLVLGPSSLEINNPFVTLHRVTSADEMYKAAIGVYEKSDVVIAAAAVADYKPRTPSQEKIKKKSDVLTLELVKNQDILYTLGKSKKSQYLVGFALETENELSNALTKLKKKNLDAIVLNSLKDKGAGFGGVTNKVTFIDKNSSIKSFDVKTKAEVAADIWKEIIDRLHA
ncbi:MAG: bifunctional phosphopantothenoylcysteine decarboxylase/phosphopantothenate--cysteine ligase CoaBC [Flavobacteriaceae bacterium]|nr:bifunctional phosphopantothenoylcysteine decarboxylase/phosphopantothenate--cysteine ligase CoaBC [Muriicola sp.]MBT8290024.1 bifunctional phosphopantothenoylcysteine decarboxylase/phosphopantothenate--cysteine ligase CoaBC [Muriicola sp.]NNC62961.1 bifunctional phosphopantothenoylcysteine decarboxylase/phosphopantothenate--cysteine ligase CoaBC [Eudoraea sp.]NNK35217.1 bifunctional phosphopantothenoylcysteine decarboxylase/phosphopantothenate--cysteine ligase CoaBC [Eudoraea sp.]NNL39712.1 